MSKSSRLVVGGSLVVAVVALLASPLSWTHGVERAAAPREEVQSREAGFRALPEDDGTLEAEGKGYGARVSADGWLSLRVAGSSSPLALRTASAVRESGAARKARRATALVHGVAEDTLDAARERFHAREHGVEQTWTFEAEPQGAGDLVVALEVRGRDYAGEGPSGLRFADHDGAVLAYGHGTWIDASGSRTSVRAAYRGGRIELRVPADVLGRSEYPAVLDPMIGPELMLDGTPTLVATNASKPAIACGTSGQCLAVWVREGGLLRGTRIDSTGAPLDATGIRLSDKTVTDADVSFTGSHYVIAFRDSSNDVYVSRVGTDAAVLAKDVPINADSSTRATAAPVVSSTSTMSLVSWATSSTVLSARLSAAGERLDNPAINIGSSNGAGTTRLTSATDGTAFLVGWISVSGSLHFAYSSIVQASGTASSPAALAAFLNTPVVALDSVWQGTSYLVTYDGKGSRVNGSGGGGTQQFSVGGVAVATDGTTIEAVAPSGLQLLKATSTADTTWGTSSPVATSASEITRPAIGWNGTGYVTVWESAGTCYTSSYTGTPASPSLGTVLARAVAEQDSTAGAWNGETYWTVWVERLGSGTPKILARRVTMDGSAVDSAPVVVAAATNVSGPLSVACNTVGRCLVAWSGSDTVYASRLDPNGVLADPQPFVVRGGLSAGASRASTASDGSGFVVAWLAGSVGSGSGVFARRVAADGTVDGSDIGVSAAATDAGRIAFAGSYFVPWYQKGHGTYVTRVGTDATVQPGSPIALCPSASSGCPQSDRVDLEAASRGDGVLVVMSGDTPLRATRLTPTGEALDTVPVDFGPSTTYPVQAAWDGSQWLIACGVFPAGPPAGRTYGVTTLASTGIAGSKFDAVYQAPSDSRSDELSTFDLVPGPAHNALALYTRVDASPDYRSVYRLRGKLVSTRLGEGASCAAPTDCLSGMCVDHLCTLPSMPDGGTTDDGGTAGDAAVTDDGGAAPTGKPRPQTSYCSIGHGSPSATSVGFVAMALALLASRRRRRERRSQSASLVGLVALVLASSTPIAPCEAQEVTDASEAATSYDETIRQAVTEFEASRFEEAL